MWKLAQQWEPLWEDIRNLAEGYGELLEQTGKPGVAQKGAGRHFLGAVVIQRVDQSFGAPETWELIDGQQRLTTLQLLLDATAKVLVAYDLPAVELEHATRNDARLCSGTELFKLWPTGGDRKAFRGVLDGDDDADENSQLVKAHRFFSTQVREWLAPNAPGATDRVASLVVTLLALLELVVIKLDGTDDAYVIFETLNARGTPLLAADLVKNFILQTAERQDKDKDSFHAKHWKHFEEERSSTSKGPWWLEEIRQGRIYRPRLDVFLNHWLVIRTQKEVKSRDLFSTFKKHVEASAKTDIEAVVQNFVHIAGAYKRLDQWPAGSPEESFIYRWGVVQAGVLTPVLLQLFAASEAELSPVRRRLALQHLESFLVRRLACRFTSKDYNRLFLDLVGQLSGELHRADEVVQEFLLGQEAYSRAWPTDTEFRDAIVTLPIYGRINQARIRMLLEGIEDAMRGAEAEHQRAPRNLQLEHLMPQKWATHWPLPEMNDGERVMAVQRREREIHTLGNLTLVRGKLNSTMSNSAWSTKRGEIDKHTTLHLNKWILDQSGDESFTEETIAARGVALANLACGVWSRPVAVQVAVS